MLNNNNEILKNIKDGFDAIANAVGKEKETVLKDVRNNNQDCWIALWWLLNPLATFGIGDKSLDKEIDCEVTENYRDIFSLLHQLYQLNGVTDSMVKNVQNYMSFCGDLAPVARGLITKSTRLGVTAKTVNKIDNNYIPQFSCMLANKYFEHPKEVEGKSFTITEKLDGIRCIAMMNPASGCVELWSRQGQRITGLVEIENELRQMWEDQCGVAYTLDGELLVSDRNSIPSKEQYKRTTKIVRTDDDSKTGITYNVFDIMPTEEFLNQNCTSTYASRRVLMEHTMKDRLDEGDVVDICYEDIYPHLHVVPVLYNGSDVNMIQKKLDEERAKDHEGVMINMNDEPYQFKRTNVLLKVKVMQDCDLKIVGVEEGSGKFTGTLGSLVVDYKGNRLGVGSGLDDDFRKMVWASPDDFIGRVATIQYFEETNNADGTLSLRFPVFKELREEGKEVSYA